MLVNNSLAPIVLCICIITYILHTPVAVWGLQGGGVAAFADTVFFVMTTLGIESSQLAGYVLK